VTDVPTKHRLEDFHLGADVYTSEGKHVGTLDRVIVDEAERTLHEVVVKESKHFSGHLLSPGSALMTDDLIVPIAAVASLTPERIDLSLDTPRMRRLYPYLTSTYAPLDSGDIASMAVSMLGASPRIPKLDEHADKRADELEIDQGENVMLGHTGKKLGEVKDVLADGDDIIGVVLHPGGLFKHEVIVPRRFFERSDDMVLFVHLTEEDLEHLAPFEADS
jgi:sporulation protein YlmC with PRC-barrel domain